MTFNIEEWRDVVRETFGIDSECTDIANAVCNLSLLSNSGRFLPSLEKICIETKTDSRPWKGHVWNTEIHTNMMCGKGFLVAVKWGKGYRYQAKMPSEKFQ